MKTKANKKTKLLNFSYLSYLGLFRDLYNITKKVQSCLYNCIIFILLKYFSNC